MQVLRAGSHGPDVERVQRTLNRRMLAPNNKFTVPPLAALAEDGRFGSKTQAMVREFQRLNQITIDGIVGRDTSYLLFPYIEFTADLAGRRERAGLEHGVRLPLSGIAAVLTVGALDDRLHGDGRVGPGQAGRVGDELSDGGAFEFTDEFDRPRAPSAARDARASYAHSRQAFHRRTDREGFRIEG